MRKRVLSILMSVTLVGSMVLAGCGEKKDAATAAAALKEAIAEINKAGSKGVYHKNTCSRKISRLTKAVNGIA